MTILRIKPGVDLLGLQPQTTLAIAVAHSCYTAVHKHGECVITEVGPTVEHSRGSRHYVGLTFDMRIHGLPNREQAVLAKMIKESLTNQYDVVLEKDHIHVEYDPER